MRIVFIYLFLLTTTFITAQNEINWDGKYQIQLSDFQSVSTQVGGVTIYSLHTVSGIDFLFSMSAMEFIFTKNFNSKVNCSFKRNGSSLVAPDSLTAIDLVNFARYEFDLSELYARKLRKKIFEEKTSFSKVSFLKPLYDRVVEEYSEIHTNAGKETDLGQKKEKLEELHEEVRKQIQELGDFCKECKLPKKKK